MCAPNVRSQRRRQRRWQLAWHRGYSTGLGIGYGPPGLEALRETEVGIPVKEHFRTSPELHKLHAMRNQNHAMTQTEQVLTGQSGELWRRTEDVNMICVDANSSARAEAPGCVCQSPTEGGEKAAVMTGEPIDGKHNSAYNKLEMTIREFMELARTLRTGCTDPYAKKTDDIQERITTCRKTKVSKQSCTARSNVLAILDAPRLARTNEAPAKALPLSLILQAAQQFGQQWITADKLSKKMQVMGHWVDPADSQFALTILEKKGVLSRTKEMFKLRA